MESSLQILKNLNWENIKLHFECDKLTLYSEGDDQQEDVYDLSKLKSISADGDGTFHISFLPNYELNTDNTEEYSKNEIRLDFKTNNNEEANLWVSLLVAYSDDKKEISPILYRVFNKLFNQIDSSRIYELFREDIEEYNKDPLSSLLLKIFLGDNSFSLKEPDLILRLIRISFHLVPYTIFFSLPFSLFNTTNSQDLQSNLKKLPKVNRDVLHRLFHVLGKILKYHPHIMTEKALAYAWTPDLCFQIFDFQNFFNTMILIDKSPVGITVTDTSPNQLSTSFQASNPNQLSTSFQASKYRDAYLRRPSVLDSTAQIQSALSASDEFRNLRKSLLSEDDLIQENDSLQPEVSDPNLIINENFIQKVNTENLTYSPINSPRRNDQSNSISSCIKISTDSSATSSKNNSNTNLQLHLESLQFQLNTKEKEISALKKYISQQNQSNEDLSLSSLFNTNSSSKIQNGMNDSFRISSRQFSSFYEKFRNNQNDAKLLALDSQNKEMQQQISKLNERITLLQGENTKLEQLYNESQNKMMFLLSSQPYDNRENYDTNSEEIVFSLKSNLQILQRIENECKKSFENSTKILTLI